MCEVECLRKCNVKSQLASREKSKKMVSAACGEAEPKGD